LAGLAHPPGAVVVPKVQSAGDLAFVDRLLDGAEAAAGGGHRLGVQALIETAEGLAGIDEIPAGSERLEALILGYADLAASLGRSGAGAATLEYGAPPRSAGDRRAVPQNGSRRALPRRRRARPRPGV